MYLCYSLEVQFAEMSAYDWTARRRRHIGKPVSLP